MGVVALGVITKATTKRQKLSITVSEPGRITVSRRSRTITKADTVTLIIALTKPQKRPEKRHKGITLTVTIMYAPRYGPLIKRRVHWTIRA